MSIILCVRSIVGKTQRLTMTKRKELVDRERGRGRDGNLRDGKGQLRDGNGPLHGGQWTLVQNPRRAWKQGKRVIKNVRLV
jgi:hypothetical protein